MCHDIPVLKSIKPALSLLTKPVIDTLFLSPLAFPRNPYHRLVKDYKLALFQLIVEIRLNLEKGHLLTIQILYCHPKKWQKMALPLLTKTAPYKLVRDAINDPVADAKLALNIFHEQYQSFKEQAEQNPDLIRFYHFCFSTADVSVENNKCKGLAEVFRSLVENWKEETGDSELPISAFTAYVVDYLREAKREQKGFTLVLLMAARAWNSEWLLFSMAIGNCIPAKTK